MTSILFEVGRELVNEVQAGMKAHQDVKEGKQVERRQDKWGDPLPPKTVYSVVRGFEETLGIGKSKGKGVGANKDEDCDQDQGTVQGPSGASDDSKMGTAPVGRVKQYDQYLDITGSTGSTGSENLPMTPSLAALSLDDSELPPRTPHKTPRITISPSPGPDETLTHLAEGPKVGHTDDKDTPAPFTLNRIELDAIGHPLPRESGLPAHIRPPPPPPLTQADKIKKGLETADDIAAEIALGVLVGATLDGPTQTLVEGLMMTENEETPQSKKNREALKAARKEIDKQTPKREELIKKLAGYQEKSDEHPGPRSQEKMEKDNKRIREKMESVRKDLEKVEGKLEKAEWEVCKYKPRVEERERLVREQRVRKALEKREKEARKDKAKVDNTAGDDK